MVKNVKGGSSHKSQARKFAGDANSLKQYSKLRVIKEDGEIYAQITKNYGNGMCDALCIDGITRLCIIRGKFRGRGKRDNTIRVGSWILAGKREWESEKSGEKQKCDLLEVYSDFDVERLKKSIQENWKVFISIDPIKPSSDEEFLVFSNSNDDEYQRVKQSFEQNTTEKISLDITSEENEICIDDI
jgi:initiation factor 1A